MSLIPPIGRHASAQRKLILPGETPTKVLLTVEAARVQLPGHTEDDILGLIEEGQIEWAWNIGLGETREIRIWPESLDRLLNPKVPCCADPAASMLSGKPFVRGHLLRLLWNCSSTHVCNLVRCGQLTVVPGTRWGTGPQGSPVITSPSVTAFLHARRVY